ncbi:uncharacterized protein N7484_001777 [Penicillium longicatenatum]|uniref:uncharacterized protein n=1 Tax=Penicillium longicatenatum TaxID=1561947 RepID=UPI0025469FBF|nr:uncharacterized protein N7484_001777 [Penicillium longicatenatum]KAJ5658128.1 hypothetical protein N7484_001777 [Penicillium longicatenatum]
MAFSFGFAGDDIDIDDTDVNDTQDAFVSTGISNSLPELVKPCKHNLDEWLSILPSQIFYNQLAINGTSIVIARREIIDIRTQLMAEDTADHENEELIAGLEKGDLKPNFYEGGFKTWECSLDLAKLVANENSIIESLDDSQTNVHIIELGSGTAVPSLTLFAHILNKTESSEGAPQRKILFTCADYNDAVLRLVTLPNLLLTWHHIRQQSNAVTADQELAPVQPEEELDITPELIEEFKNDLTRRGVVLNFISGAWSPEFVGMVFEACESQDFKTVLLASETIYSPASLKAFSETLVELLRRSSTSSAKSRAMIAAKKVYFGVGGGVDEFLAVLKDVSASELAVEQRLDVQSEGVGRVVLEVTPAN